MRIIARLHNKGRRGSITSSGTRRTHLRMAARLNNQMTKPMTTTGVARNTRMANTKEVSMLGIVPDFPAEVGLLEGSIQAFCEEPRRAAA